MLEIKNTITVVTANSHSLTDTVDTDCITVAAMNRCYCRQLLAEQQSECQNAIGSLIQVQKICPAQEITPQTILIPQVYCKNFQRLFSVRATF